MKKEKLNNEEQEIGCITIKLLHIKKEGANSRVDIDISGELAKLQVLGLLELAKFDQLTQLKLL